MPNREAARRRRPPAFTGDDAGLPPRQAAQEQGLRFPADPPPVEEIIAVTGAAGNGPDGARLRALIIVLWRAGLRISEALDLAETDFDRSRGAVVVRAGKGGRRREVGMDRWAWGQLTSYLEIRAALPVGALFCVIHGPTAGRRWEASVARKPAASNGGSGGRPSALCASSAQACPRCRGRPRGRPAGGHPAATRALQFGGHQHLPPGNRQQRDHRDGPFPARTGDLSDIRPAPPLGSNGLLICRGRPARGRAATRPPVHLRAGAHARCGRASPQVAKSREAPTVL